MTNIQAIARFFKNNPYNPWGNSKGTENQNPWGNRPNNDGQKPGKTPGQQNGKKLEDNFGTKFDAAMKKFDAAFKKISDNSSNNNDSGDNSKSIFGLIIMSIILFWLASGIYKVDSDENGLVMYFGKFYSVATPGLNYHLPAPFGKVIIKKVTAVNTEEFGADSSSSRNFSNNSANNSNSLMLTGDENIVDIDFQIQWQISDIKDFVFNIQDPELTIRKAAESAMREIIARTPIADALSNGKSKVERQSQDLLQEILDSYGAGVRVVLVQLRRVDPPAQVIDAFRDVQTAKADKEREINQAQSYSNDIIPRARGEAAKIIEDAKAYSQEVVADAEGQASRFNAVYAQYINAKAVTKKRMYLEQMEKVYRDVDKIIIDKNASKTGLLPYLPINNKLPVK